MMIEEVVVAEAVVEDIMAIVEDTEVVGMMDFEAAVDITREEEVKVDGAVDAEMDGEVDAGVGEAMVEAVVGEEAVVEGRSYQTCPVYSRVCPTLFWRMSPKDFSFFYTRFRVKTRMEISLIVDTVANFSLTKVSGRGSLSTCPKRKRMI